MFKGCFNANLFNKIEYYSIISTSNAKNKFVILIVIEGTN